MCARVGRGGGLCRGSRTHDAHAVEKKFTPSDQTGAKILEFFRVRYSVCRPRRRRYASPPGMTASVSAM